MRLTAKIISVIFQPVFVPLYGTLLLISGDAVLSELTFRSKAIVISVVALCTCLVPVAVVATGMKMGKIKDAFISLRSARTLPYLLSFFGYVLCILLLHRIGLSMFYVAPIIGSAVSIMIIFIINFRWKISAHLCASGGLAGGIFAYSFIFGLIPLILFSTAVFIGGLVGWSRMYLNAHTLAQVCAGWLLGFCSIAVTWGVSALLL